MHNQAWHLKMFHKMSLNKYWKCIKLWQRNNDYEDVEKEIEWWFFTGSRCWNPRSTTVTPDRCQNLQNGSCQPRPRSRSSPRTCQGRPSWQKRRPSTWLKGRTWHPISVCWTTFSLDSGKVRLWNQSIYPWSSSVVGDEGCIGPSISCCFYVKPSKIYSICMALFHTCLTVGPIQLFISFY